MAAESSNRSPVLGLDYMPDGFRISSHCTPRPGDEEGCDTSACYGVQEYKGGVLIGDIENGTVRQDYPDGRPAVIAVGRLAYINFIAGVTRGDFAH